VNPITTDDTPVTTNLNGVIDLRGTLQPDIIDCQFAGNRKGAGEWWDVPETFTTPCMIDLEEVSGATVSNCKLSYANVLIRHRSLTSEANLSVLANKMAGCSVGLMRVRGQVEFAPTGISLANPGVVTFASSAWLTATAYVEGDVRTNGGFAYFCIVAHTSGTFATDLAASKWRLIETGLRVFIKDVVGMTEVNDRQFNMGTCTTTTFQLKHAVTGANINTSGYTTYLSGGKIWPLDGAAQQANLFGAQNHIHARDAAIEAVGTAREQIHHNDISISGTSPVNGVGYGMWFMNFNEISPDHNSFAADGTTTTVDIFGDSNMSVTTARGFWPTNNAHGHAGVVAQSAVKADTGTVDVRVLNPFFRHGTSYTLALDLPATSTFAEYNGIGTDNQLKTIEGKSGNASENPKLGFYRNSASPADNDLLGGILFDGNNDATPVDRITYGRITGRADDVSDTTEDGGLNFSSIVAGTEVIVGGTTSTGWNAITDYRVNSTKVVGAQGAAVADASGGGVIDAEARTALNTLLARLRTHGLIAT
jgi:hypothetical protein